MYIKNLFNIKNYKGIDDGFRVEFDDVTYIVGDNAKNKTTIGSLPLWILTGYNLYGNNKEQVANDQNKGVTNTTASMTIVDNSGTQHIITRCKGKDDCIILDGTRTTKEVISRLFYKDIHAFLCAYNPNYFRSMELSKQRELLIRILPSISSEEAFKLLDDSERAILEKPVLDIVGFSKAKRAEVKELKSNLDQMVGSKNAYISIALEREGELKKFDKQEELDTLEEEYEKLITDTDNIISIEDIAKDIQKIQERIVHNINVELKGYQTKLKKEQENLDNVSLEKATCPTCKQEIENESLTKALIIHYKKNINELTKKIQNLKEETKELLTKKKAQDEKYKILKTPEMQEQTKLKNELKQKIELLQKEKSEIDLFNKEVTIKHNNIVNAKKEIEKLEALMQEVSNRIEICNKQIQTVARLNLLIMQEQMKKISGFLDKVTIEFNKVNEETGEISETYEVKYDGRSYEKLSKSYKIRADIEISQLINKIVQINSPMFIDDVESITQINLKPNIQTILSIVVKYNDLEILNSYPEVLIRERKSINKKIEENSNILENVA